MMESINLDRSGVSGGGGTYSSDRRSSSTQDHFPSHGPPGASGGYPSNNTIASAGKKKTDQVVLEFLYKTVEVVLLSRAYFQPSTPRRARFNLDIQELPHVRDLMRPCRDNVNEPVVLDIAMDSILLERWQISYTSGVQAHSPLDVINQLREVCRRIGILLRSVYCLARILPAFPVGDRLKTQQEDLGHPVVGLQYSLASSTDATTLPWDFEPDQPKQRYSFVPIDTPFGTLQLSVLYRKRNDDLLAAIQRMTRLPAAIPHEQSAHYAEDDHPHASLQMSSTLTRAIIQDYVPTSANTTPTSSPLLQPSATPPVANLSPLMAPQASPMLRSSPMRIVQEMPDNQPATAPRSLQDGRAAVTKTPHNESHRRGSDAQPPREEAVAAQPQAIPRRHMSLDLTSATSSPQYRITSQPVRIPHSANAAAIASNSAASSPLLHHGSGGIVRAHSSHLNNHLHHAPHSLHHQGSGGSSGPSLYAHAHSLDAATDLPQRHQPHAAATNAAHRPTQPLAAPYGYAHARPIDASPRYPQSPLQQPLASPAYSSSPLLRHPNSAPLPRPSPRHRPNQFTPHSTTTSPQVSPLMPAATPAPDARFSVGSSSQGSTSGEAASSQPRSSSTSPVYTAPPPPFSVGGSARANSLVAGGFVVNGQHQPRTQPLFGISQSPPFRGYSAELTSTSPTATTTPPPSRLLTAKEKRRPSLDAGTNWGITDAPNDAVFGLGQFRNDDGDDPAGALDQLCLPFATSSATLSSMSSLSGGTTSGLNADTMSVSAFLHQLKQAPPLHTATSANRSSATAASLAAVERDLAFFKQLRDHLHG